MEIQKNDTTCIVFGAGRPDGGTAAFFDSAVCVRVYGGVFDFNPQLQSGLAANLCIYNYINTSRSRVIRYNIGSRSP